MKPRLLLLTLACLPAATALAKPLYITVPKSFSTDEACVVDLAFERREPVELRLLQPESVERFVTSQANLRRAYDPPVLQANPGRYLSRGLNAARAPGRFLLFSMSSELREALAGEMPKRPEEEPLGSGRPLSQLTEGAPKLVGLPPGMRLLKSEWLNLDLGGRERDYSVPGFDEWGGGSGFEERRLSLGKLPAGLYVVQLVQGRIEGQVLLVVSDLSVQVKQTDGALLVRAAGRDQRPRAGAKVEVFAPGGKKLSAETDERGEARLDSREPRVVVTVAAGADLALVDTDFYSSLAVAPDVFIYSDRPIYKPGDEVQFRGLVRRPDSFLARLFAPRKREVTVKLVSAQGAEINTKAPLDDFGAFHGKLAVPKELPTGVLRVVAELDGDKHASESRVQEYVKPTFYLELDSAADGVTPGSAIEVKVRARRYAGGPPANTAYEVFLYRTVLDSPAWVDDAGMGGQGSAVTYGSRSTTEGGLSVPKRLYSSLEARGGGSWEDAPRFDAAGEASITVPVPALEPGEDRLPFKYTLTVRARDEQGGFANGSKTLFLAPSDVMGALSMSAKIVTEGGPASLAVKATTLGGKSFGVADGRCVLVHQAADGVEREVLAQDFRTGDDGLWRLKLPTERAGSLLARIVLKDSKGRPWSGETTMLIAGRKGEPVARVPALLLESLSGALEPGDMAQLVALFPEGWGPEGKARGPVWLTLSGGEIYETRVIELAGTTLLYSFEIERRFGSAVYASVGYPTRTGRWEERTVPFRVVPKERVLSVDIEPELAEAPPLGTQRLFLTVRDSRGRGVEAELSVGVVDKAVYAVQSEFRPAVLDFFYPLARDNVMSFYSAEFQGYGYGEVLARAMGLARPYEFAAVKPPNRKTKERDTAYWNPAVRTDADGHAVVRFELPSNQTLWTVTAVAADASGRFGERTAEFATRGALNVVAAAPPFLRAGDRAQASVRLSRGTEGQKLQALEVTLAASGRLTGAEVKQELELPPSGEQVLPIELSAGEPGAGALLVKVSGQDSPLAERRALEVLPATLEETLVATRSGAGELALALPAGATVLTRELSLHPSVLEAALSAAGELLTYPYGCLEQLVSTTLPNVAVTRVLERTQSLSRLDADSRALLALARSRAAQGSARILDLAVKGAGFTWFTGYDTPSAELTIIALDGLVHAVQAGLVDRNDPRISGAEKWLAGQDLADPGLDAARVHALVRLDPKRHAALARALLGRVDVADLYAVAMATLAAEHAGIDGEAGVKARLAELVAAARAGAPRVASGAFPYPRYWRYPLRPSALQAALEHAAHATYSAEELIPIRQRLIGELSSGAPSTFERGQLLLHGLWLLERDLKELKSGPAPRVELDGQQLRLLPRGTGWAARLPAGNGAVQVGLFEGSARLSARVSTPLAQVAPRAEGLSLERSYYLLGPSGKTRLERGAAVKQGELVYVELRFDAPGEQERSVRSAYTVLSDAVPAGFEPIIEDKVYRGAPYDLLLAHDALRRRELSPERATFFFEEPAWWGRSPRVVGYVLRAAFSGRFTAPPARVEDMYAAQVYARTGAEVLEVKPTP